MVFLTVKLSDGRKGDAVLLAVSRDRMRLALQGQTDTIELRRAGDEWVDEFGDAVSLDYFWTADGSSIGSISEDVFPMVSTARH
ncbi:MAG: hypothetical protein C5B51_00650 [Terriglobia bacterium]|nr:MAG: hypothetical protein C5B51_00650 [Terriglobia bacterium]